MLIVEQTNIYFVFTLLLLQIVINTNISSLIGPFGYTPQKL